MRRKLFAVLLSAALVTSSTATVFAKDITITVPNYGTEESTTEESATDLPEAKETVTNSDGSTSYTLDKKQQKKWKKYLKNSFDDYIKQILNDDDNYPNVDNITYNDDMTEFEIQLTSSDLAPSEYFIGFLPLLMAPTYQQVNGVPEKDVDYKLVVKDTSSGSETTQTYKENKADWESFESSMNSTSSDTASATDSSETKVDKISLSSDSSSLEYSGFETMPYEDGSSDILGVVKFNFINKTDSPNSAPSFYNIKAYQNGVELTWYTGSGNAVCDNTYKTVLKDTYIETGFAFMLQDTENPITVYAYDGFMSDSPCQIQEIEIN